MAKIPMLFVTSRGERHQKAALDAAPDIFDITMRRDPPREEILSLLPKMEILVSERTGVIDAELINAGKNLRLIQRLGSRTHDIDLQAAKKAGIPVCYWPVLTCVMVAEHMMTLLLALAKNLKDLQVVANEAKDWGHPPKKCDENYFIYNWSGRKINSLYRSTVGIVGLGEVGTELAKRLKPFECTMLYNDIERLPEFAENELNVHFANLDDLLAQCDYVCVQMPLFPQTQYFVNAAFLARMKRGACLVACGAGGVLHEADIAAALQSGQLGGLGTDTYDYEPIAPDNPLLPLARQPSANVILTPHTAGGTVAASREERGEDFTNPLNLLQGKPLEFRIA